MSPDLLGPNTHKRTVTDTRTRARRGEAGGWNTCKLEYLPLFTCSIPAHHSTVRAVVREYFWTGSRAKICTRVGDMRRFFFLSHKQPCGLSTLPLRAVPYCLFWCAPKTRSAPPTRRWEKQRNSLGFLGFFFCSGIKFFHPHTIAAAVAGKLGLCYLRCIAVKGSALQWISIG